VKSLGGVIRFGLAAALLMALPTQAQNYPQRPLRVIVPLAAGGGMDTVTRSLAHNLNEIFKQNVVVDNRPGAGSMIGLGILSSAAPDGHTLMMISATTIIHPILYKSRFDVTRDFAPVSQVTEQGYALVLHPSIPATSMKELVQYLRDHPGQVNYSSSGIGSPIHMTTELFQLATGTRMTHVPYKGMGAAYPDLVGGRIQMSFATIISSLPHVKNKRLRALAVTPDKRAPALPETPTLREAGVDLAVVNFYGLIAPSGTRKAVLDHVSSETAKVMHRPDVMKRLVAEGSSAVGSTPAEFAARLRAEHERWTKVIKEARIRGTH